MSTNQISGKVILKETNSGIPDVLVVLYDVDPETRPEEIVANLTTTSAVINNARSVLGGLGDRIGSVLTGADGSFILSYEDGEFRIRNEGEKRPDLLLLAFAPEAAGKALNDLILFASPEIRQNAGRIETYLIQLTADQLTKAGMPVPQEQPIPEGDPEDEDLRILERKLQAGKRFFDRKAALLQLHVEQEHQKHAKERTATFSAKVKEELSLVPKALRDSRFFVADGESIKKKVFDNTATQIQETFNNPVSKEKKPKATGFIYLTKAQVAKYKEFIKGDEYVLPDSVIEQEILPKLFGGNSEDGTGNDFLMDHPAVRLCARAIHGDIDCKTHTHPTDGDKDPKKEDNPSSKQEDNTPLKSATPEDVKSYIARQMEHVTAPEGTLNFGVEVNGRASAGKIGEQIGQLKFEKGPADTPAFYDFHVLKIAFEHVWKEATDQGILAQGEALYDEVVGTGKRPINLKDLILDVKSTLQFLKNEPQRETPVPPVEVIFEFPDAVSIWDKMTTSEQIALTKITTVILGKYSDTLVPISIPSSNSRSTYFNPEWGDFFSGKSTKVPSIDKEHLITNEANEAIAIFRQKGLRILDNVYERVEEAQEVASDFDRYKKAAELAEALNNQLKQRYSFTYFAADGVERSVNFGVLLTYRQKWDPVGYQAGELVHTIPLAPKETRKYSKKTVVKKSRSQKEIEDNLRITKTDTSDTSRAESEIVNKAMNKTTFALNTSSTFDIPLGEEAKIGNTVTTNMTNEAQRESNQTKKDFRESVIKAAQEHKNERRIEITTESTYESEITESGEISNPNDELTVTYLFYELQRQFRVNERLHRMRPVVLVAQEMPAPHEIDDDWIIRHDWILKRALMDDSFLYAFDCITHLLGDKLMLDELDRTVREQRKIIRDLRQNVKFYTDETGRMSRLMQAAINKEAAIAEDRDFWDGIPLLGGALDSAESAIKGVGGLLGMGKGDEAKEGARLRREGVKDAYERADRERRELLGRLEHETGVLNGLTKQVAEKRKEINEKEVLIARLKNHLKDNILHYMQAIWSYEHPDQRFFRLFNTMVPILKAPKFNLQIKKNASPAAMLDGVVNLDKPKNEQKTRHEFTFSPELTIEEKTLEEVAELDNLLGFKGNLMIFPLRKSNVLTDFMMAPYVDSEFGLLDPDAPGNWTLEEFEQLYCCLKENLGDSFSEIEPQLKEFYRQLLLDPLRPGELITVPTGSLFIEALPGAHPVLENFKALHRAVDVKKVQAEVRKLELENIRYAARILEGEHDDPDTEKKVIINKTDSTIVEPS